MLWLRLISLVFLSTYCKLLSLTLKWRQHGQSYMQATLGLSTINISRMYLVSQGCIKVLCDLLIYPDPMIVAVCLKGLENILKVGELEKNEGNNMGVNPYAQLIDEAKGLEKIENLQSHDDTEIYKRAAKILEIYWLLEDVETLPLGDALSRGFSFGGNELQVPSGGFNFPFYELRTVL
ncbi:importin subunit alpha-1b-like isoform X4 [Macadamia integrifolia]|uniref:importin subunit alpha-1b-like isoform X4 n=1 Tax=Macadamia integrifolia TaxID=60698 RepID=UPI001C4F0E91|nr:importin subunit alpha-1b-like isoform X4 [Macadamia integrifolia]